MCLIYVAWRSHPRYGLVVAANRDELHARPAAPAHWWDDAPRMLAGRDLEAGGTWLGVTAEGRFAAITNYHDPASHRAGAPSRGALVSGFLTGSESAPNYLERILQDARACNGFSLLAMDGDTLAFASNRAHDLVRLTPGIHGLSNHLLDTPWPKVTTGKAELKRLLAEPDLQVSDLLALLAPHLPPGEESLRADIGGDLEPMRWRSARFILGPAYGTRTSTVVLLDADGGGVFVERSFDAGGAATGEVAYELDARPDSHRTARNSRLVRASS